MSQETVLFWIFFFTVNKITLYMFCTFLYTLHHRFHYSKLFHSSVYHKLIGKCAVTHFMLTHTENILNTDVLAGRVKHKQFIYQYCRKSASGNVKVLPVHQGKKKRSFLLASVGDIII